MKKILRDFDLSQIPDADPPVQYLPPYPQAVIDFDVAIAEMKDEFYD